MIPPPTITMCFGTAPEYAFLVGQFKSAGRKSSSPRNERRAEPVILFDAMRPSASKEAFTLIERVAPTAVNARRTDLERLLPVVTGGLPICVLLVAQRLRSVSPPFLDEAITRLEDMEARLTLLQEHGDVRVSDDALRRQSCLCSGAKSSCPSSKSCRRSPISFVVGCLFATLLPGELFATIRLAALLATPLPPCAVSGTRFGSPRIVISTDHSPNFQ
jgi:hypothetical protein